MHLYALMLKYAKYNFVFRMVMSRSQFVSRSSKIQNLIQNHSIYRPNNKINK